MLASVSARRWTGMTRTAWDDFEIDLIGVPFDALPAPGRTRTSGAFTMSITFYCSPMSTATITHVVLEELGLAYEIIQLDLKKGDTKKPEFLAINPNGKVPAIVHDGKSIWESTAITMYLGETYGVEKKLYPTPGPQRAEAMMWITWANVTLGETIARYARNAQEWVPEEQRNAKAGEAAKLEMGECLRILDKALEGKAFLLGDYSLADTHLHLIVDWIRYLELDLSSYSGIEAWSKRCQDRPAYAKVSASFSASS